MTTRPGLTRNTQNLKSTSQTSLGGINNQSIAAKEADIKRFNEIMQAKKDSEKKNTPGEHHSPGEQQAAESARVHQVADCSATINHGQVYSQYNHAMTDHYSDEALHAQHSDQIARTHVGTVSTQQSNEVQQSNPTKTVVAIIDRIMNSVESSTDPKIWTIEIALDKHHHFQLQLQHHGSNQWSLQLDPDAQGRHSTTDDIADEFEQFSAELKVELSRTRPNLQIIAGTNA